MAMFDLHSSLNTVLPTISIMHNAHMCVQVANGLSLALFSDFESYHCIIATVRIVTHQNTLLIQSPFFSTPTYFDRVSLSSVRLLEWRQILQVYIIRYNHLNPVHILRGVPGGSAVQGVLWGRSLAGTAGSNPAIGLDVGARPEESCRVLCVWVWYRNLINEEV